MPNLADGGFMMSGQNTMAGMQHGDGLMRTQPILNPHVTQSRTCMLHGKPLRYFCDTCEELLCYDCTVMGGASPSRSRAGPGHLARRTSPGRRPCPLGRAGRAFA